MSMFLRMVKSQCSPFSTRERDRERQRETERERMEKELERVQSVATRGCGSHRRERESVLES